MPRLKLSPEERAKRQREYQKAYRQKHKARLYEREKEWRRRNPEKVREYNRRKRLRYAQTSPEKISAINGRYKAKRKEKARWFRAQPWLTKAYIERHLARGRDLGDVAILAGVKVSRLQAILEEQ